MDYNIYIHKDFQSGKPTQPKQAEGQESPTQPKLNSKMVSVIQNPDSLMSMATGSITKIMGVGVAVTALKVGYGIVNNVINTYNSFATISSGDYRLQESWGNTTQTISNVLHPYSTFIHSLQSQYQNRVENGKREQERLLLGDSLLGTKNGRYL